MRLKIENQNFFFNLVNKGHKVDIFNKEISSIDFFCSRTERVKSIANWQNSDDFQYFPKMKTMKTVFLFMQISFK